MLLIALEVQNKRPFYFSEARGSLGSPMKVGSGRSNDATMPQHVPLALVYSDLRARM